MKVRMKQAFLVFLFVLICVAVLYGCSQKEKLAFEATYAIDAHLDPEARSMT